MSAPPPAPLPPPSGGVGTPPPPPPRADDPRGLSRLRHGKVLGGVAAGIAAHLRVDPVLTRVGFVILGFVPFPGFGLLLYLVLLVILPVSDDPAALPVRDRTDGRGAGFYIGVALVALGGVWVLGAASGGGDLFPLLLVGLGVALWVDADRRGDRTSVPPSTTRVPDPEAPLAMDATTAPAPRTPPSPSEAPTERVRTWAPPIADTPGGPSGPGRPPVGRAWTPPPDADRAPRERSPLGRITIGLALLAAGAVWLLGQLDVIDGSGATILAAPLAVLGAGLLVGSVVGRARWLALVAVPLALVTLGAALLATLDLPLDAGFDDRQVVITSTEQLTTSYELTGGALRIDLTELDASASDDPLALTGAVAGGTLIVTVPEGAGVVGSARVQAGELRAFGEDSRGNGVERELDVRADPGEPTYELDLLVGYGELRIDSQPTPDETEEASP